MINNDNNSTVQVKIKMGADTKLIASRSLTLISSILEKFDKGFTKFEDKVEKMANKIF